MFAIALSRTVIPTDLDGFRVEHFDAGALKLTVASDAPARLDVHADGFRLVVSPITSEDDTPGLPFVEADFDRARGTLELHRTLIATAPLYYYHGPGGEFICGTGIRLLRELGVPLEEETKRLPEFFTHRRVLPPNTLFRGVLSLEAGSSLVVRTAGSESAVLQESRYAVPRMDSGDGARAANVGEAARTAIELLEGALSPLRPHGDGTTVLLSGGIDSSALFRIAQRVIGTSESYSTGFPFEDPRQNRERQYALSAARALRSTHHYVEPTANEYLRGVVEAIAAAEEPLVHLQSVLLYRLFQDALQPRAETPRVVVMAGTAERFGGSYGERRLYSIRRYRQLLRLGGLSAGGPTLRFIAALSERLDRGVITVDMLTHHAADELSLDDPEHPIWFEMSGSEEWTYRYFDSSRDEALAGRRDLLMPYAGRSLLEIVMVLGHFINQHTQSLWGQLALAAGFAAYDPFSSPSVAGFAYSLPIGLRAASHKHVLTEVNAQLGVPPFISTRPKQAFSLAIARWATPQGALAPLVPLAATIIPTRDILKMQSSEPARAYTYWNILNYAIWKRLWINGESLDALLAELEDSSPTAAASRAES